MNLLDLFSGIGGFSLGLERAGMKTVAFCEIDTKAQLVLKKHWPNAQFFEDVSTLKKEDIHEKVDVICGGFPCQDISLAGRGAGLAGARSGLWYEFHRLINEIRPRYAIIENVSALRSRGLDKVLGSLSKIGYDAEWHCIPASAVGAPHRRDRIWIVAYPNSEWELQQKGSEQNERGRACNSSENVAYPNCTQRKGGGVPSRILAENTHFGGGSWWEVEPNVGRVAYGVPNWSHRLKQLGNAVVPQIPEIIGGAIISHNLLK
jgi:DNA (cytosine-5)-methyltransferase 1